MKRTQTKIPTTLPRGLIFLSSGWLLFSWIIAVGIRPPIQPSSSVYTPAAQVLLTSIVLGGLVAWPLLRLSGAMRERPAIQALLDVVSLCVLLQIILWPLRLVTAWTIARLLLIDGSMCAWLMTTAAILATSISQNGRIRTLAMALLITWLIAPLLIAISWPQSGMGFAASPLGAIWLLSSDGGALTDSTSWRLLWVNWGISGLAWALVAVLAAYRRLGSTDTGSRAGDTSLEEIA